MGRSFDVPLPATITLDAREVLLVLEALDLAADERAMPAEQSRAARQAVKLLTRKLWAELGDILDEES